MKPLSTKGEEKEMKSESLLFFLLLQFKRGGTEGGDERVSESENKAILTSPPPATISIFKIK
jgi:hypothetical protein